MSNRLATPRRSTKRVATTLAIATLLLLTAALVASELLAGMFRPWNDIRLAPSAGLLHGYALYSAPGEPGPIWSWIYGPVATLVYLPTALLSTPARALGAALLATAAIYLTAARGLLALSTRARGRAFEASFAALVLYSLAEPALRGAGFWIHADAPAIGFAAIACAAIATPQRRARPAALALCALASVLAIGSKQVLAPLPLALGGTLMWTAGRRAATIWLGWLAGCAAAASLGFGVAFGWESLVFNLITIPLAHPWQWGGGAGAVARAAGELLLHAAPLLALLAFDRSREDDATPWREHPRALLLAAALALSLGAVATRVKFGAGLNAHAFALFFLAVAAAGALADACARGSARARTALGATLATGLVLGAAPLTRLPELVRSLPDNPETTGYALARQAPGTVYFPSHPLVTLYAEGRASHVSYGLFDRDLAGHRVADEHFRAFTAPRLERVALWATRDAYTLDRLPELTHLQEHGSQPGWLLLGSPGDDAHSRP